VLFPLAQTTPGWALTFGDFARAALVFVATAVILMLIMFPFRRFLRRTQLLAPGLHFLLAASVTHGIMSLPGPNGEPVLHSNNIVTYWTTRFFMAALLYLTLRIIDRLLLVPLLPPTRARLRRMINITLVMIAIVVYFWIAFG
jgi:hypothetical protein